jgi:hypothetical protein
MKQKRVRVKNITAVLCPAPAMLPDGHSLGDAASHSHATSKSLPLQTLEETASRDEDTKEEKLPALTNDLAFVNGFDT